MKKDKFNCCHFHVEIPEYTFNLQAVEFQKTNEEFAVWFFEGILENYPNYVECLMYLGNAYTARGMYEKGLQVDLKLVELRPCDPMVHYNIACSYSLLGKIDLAFASLNKSIDFGYTDLKHFETDSDLDRLRGEEQYKTIINKLKEVEQKHVS
ncbi:MAG: hypothetical protein D8M57_15280 [Candidatus Scalindua sp. AMX11]|nr:MAG: hypothetical protein DWQ00_02370 [Candidatus Scalindua sp.]NOG84012.1 hypothetical protein [Planctomycetota bacterium]RZV88080.1 MAG: hypothetical protein EX341_07165 [Candidatus Scalindua sp. SCAELEC01]TDE64013.1 MAG: hypothetical protein D8M57_15280 [Candidatus Scalindua sp. AMX11]GJQ60510.1 MAG: hypothetical protein SCALA701_33110 [Candidatus Scalindua sp.]